MDIEDKAKNLLLDHTCNNCYYHTSSYKHAGLWCLKDNDYSYPEHNIYDICDQWYDSNISITKRIIIAKKFSDGIYTKDHVDKLTKILMGDV